jgi:hypothetical protein
MRASSPPMMGTDSDGATSTDLSVRPRLLWGLIASILVMNLLDAVFTLVWIGTGRATEANPLMAVIVRTHPVLFVVVKTTLVSLGLLLLWRLRRSPLAIVGIFVAFIVYYMLITIHLGALEV